MDFKYVIWGMHRLELNLSDAQGLRIGIQKTRVAMFGVCGQTTNNIQSSIVNKVGRMCVTI